MDSRKKTKIVATIGLASEGKEMLLEMVEAGMNVARLNFSHGTHEWHGNVIKIIREVSKEAGRPIGILADLQGPRIRVGNTEPFEIEKGEIIVVSDSKTTDGKELIIDSDGVAGALQVDERIMIEDGVMRLRVVEKLDNSVRAEVLNGGTIKPRKGINVPDTKLHFGAVTEKDRKDLEFVLSQEVDFVALSFVSNAKEVLETRENMKKILGREDNLPQIVVKIERKEAIDNIDEIIEATDVVMVARGDLGIEIEGCRVAVLQKEIIKKSLQYLKPVIVATQMLDSMINNPIPTRAEVSDVTNAVIDHTDAVMLSGESAGGKYPVESVRTMADIIQHTEISPFDDVTSILKVKDNVAYNAIIESAYELARASKAKAIVMGSASGETARLLSHFRPEQQIFVVTHNEKTYYQLSLAWGVKTQLFEIGGVFREDIDWLIDRAKKLGELSSGDKVIVIMGKMPNDEKIKLLGVKEIE